MQTMQAILWRGLADHRFEEHLIARPFEALAGYDLSASERSVLAETPAAGLHDLALRAEAWRRGEPPAHAAPGAGTPARVNERTEAAAMAPAIG